MSANSLKLPLRAMGREVDQTRRTHVGD